MYLRIPSQIDVNKTQFFVGGAPQNLPMSYPECHLHRQTLQNSCPQSRPDSDEAEELLPAAPGEGLGAPVRRPPFLGLSCLVLDGGEDGGVKRLLQVLLRERRALHVILRSDLLRHPLRPRAGHGLDAGAVQANEHVDVQQEVRLRAHQDNGRGGVGGTDRGHPLLGDVVEGSGVDHAEAQQEDVRVRVGQRSELIKLLLKRPRQRESMVLDCKR